jgi:thiol-disulfide isomerase/thioredoxin
MKYLYQIIYSTLFAVLFIHCNAKEKRVTQHKQTYNTRSNEIKLTIISKLNSFTGFHYFDQFGNLNQIALGKDLNKFKHEEVINSKKPILLYYSTAPQIIPFLLYPGDSLSFEITAEKISIINSVKGVDASIKVPLNYSIFLYESVMSKVPINKRERFLDSCYLITNKALIQNETEENKPIIDYYLKAAIYTYLQNKLIRKSVDKSPDLKKYIDSISSIVNDETFCYSQEHKKLVRTYSMTLWGNDYKDEKHHRKIYDSSRQYYQGDVRNFKLFDELKAMRSQKSIYYNDYRKLFLDDCSNQDLNLFVQSNFKATSGKLDDLLLTYQNKNFKFSEIIDKYKGNVIFIDFWASWCLPCRKEIPFALKLMEKYTNAKFKYVFISIDENFDSWEEAITKEDIIKMPDSYIVSNATESSLIENYQIKSVPRYLLFDKTGKLVNANSIAPSDPKIIQIVNDLMKAVYN